MADAEKTIDLVFKGVDRTGAAVQGVLNNTNRITSGIQSATQPFATASAAAIKYEAAILGAGAALVGFAINEAATFESALADLNKVLGADDSLDDFAQQARNLSEAYGESSVAIVDSIANYKQAGFTAKEAGELTKVGLDFVIAGGLEAAAASEILVSSLKGFGAGAEEAAGFVDLLNEVSNNYATTSQELGEGFAALSPIARATGFSLQETVAVLTPGIEVFRSGSEVARALRTSFQNLTSDLPRVTSALKTLGVEQRDQNGELRSARDIYFDVAKALQDVDDNQRAFLSTQIAGKDQSAKFLAVIDGFDKSLQIAGEGFQFVGSAAKEVDIQLATADRAFARVGESLRNLFKDLGAPLLDDFSGLGDALVDVFRQFADNLESGNLGDITSFIEGVFNDAEEAAREIARNLPAALERADFSGFTDGLTTIGDAISSLFGGADFTQADQLADALTAIANGFRGLSEFSGGVIESFGPLIQKVTELGKSATDGDKSLRGLGNAFGTLTQVNIVAGAVSNVTDVLAGLGIAIFGATKGFGALGGVTKLSSALSGTGGLASSLQGIAALGAGAAIGNLANELSRITTGETLSQKLSDWLTGFTDLNDEAAKLEETVRPTAEQAAQDIKRLDDALNRSNQSIKEGVDFWGLYGSESGSAIATIENLDKEWNEIQQAIRGAADETNNLADASKKITVDEKLALIKTNGEIAVASIQSNTQKLSTTFESVNTSINSAEKSLGNLFGLLGDENISKFDKLGIQEQIDIQNERAEKALQLQERLVKSQLREINDRREAFRNGGALINIDGAGLQPHLEAFMFEILESIQVRVNAEGYNLLLGAD